MPFLVFISGVQAGLPYGAGSYWIHIARSSGIYVINSNDLKNHLSVMDSSVKNQDYYYSVRVIETIKGTEETDVTFVVYLQQEFIDYIRKFPDDARLIIFFDLFSGGGNPARKANYFAGTLDPEEYYEKSIIVYTDMVYNQIVDEVRRQQIILQNKLYEAFQRDESMDRGIKGRIDELTNVEREFFAFDEIIIIGEDAVPYIILNMEDYRELPIKYACINDDSPDAWEAIKQYGPSLVIDMLSIALYSITKVDFKNIFNGYSVRNEDRQRALDGWRIYLYYRYVGNELNRSNE
jgi:hypothetical protein